MKQLIKRWLGITDLAKEVRDGFKKVETTKVDTQFFDDYRTRINNSILDLTIKLDKLRFEKSTYELIKPLTTKKRKYVKSGIYAKKAKRGGKK